MGRDLEGRLKRLEAQDPDPRAWGRYGADGMRLVQFAIEPLDPGTRLITEADVEWLRSQGESVLYIPDYDDRFQNPDGSIRDDLTPEMRAMAEELPDDDEPGGPVNANHF